MHQIGQADYTSAENYRDEDGNLKSFTFLDMDKKTTVGAFTPGDKEWEPVFRSSLISQILTLSASLCPIEWQDFTKRGSGYEQIEWDEVMIGDKGIDIWKLCSLKNILSNRLNQYTKTY